MDPAVTGPNETAKDSLQAFRFPFVAYAGGGKIKIWGRTPTSQSGTVHIVLNKAGGGTVTLANAMATAGGIFTKTYTRSERKGSLTATFAGRGFKELLARAASGQVRPSVRLRRRRRLPLALAARDGEEPRAEARVVERPL